MTNIFIVLSVVVFIYLIYSNHKSINMNKKNIKNLVDFINDEKNKNFIKAAINIEKENLDINIKNLSQNIKYVILLGSLTNGYIYITMNTFIFTIFFVFNFMYLFSLITSLKHYNLFKKDLIDFKI